MSAELTGGGTTQSGWDLRRFEKGNIVGHCMHGEQMTIGVFELEPNRSEPEHTHATESSGAVVRGVFNFTVAGVTRRLEAGGIFMVPAGAPHAALAGPEGATVVEIFTPARRDWDANGWSKPV